MNSPTVIGQPALPDACRTAPNKGVSLIRQCKALEAAKRLDKIALDEGVDYFSAQGAIDAHKLAQSNHDSANEKFLARLNELMANRLGAA